MAESRQLSVRLSAATFDKLAAIKPEGISLAEVARKILEKALAPEQLPLLQGERGPRVASIDWKPFLAEMAELKERLASSEDLQRETLRAVQEQAAWSRLRLLPKGDAEMDRKAANAGEQAVRDWERSMGR